MKQEFDAVLELVLHLLKGRPSGFILITNTEVGETLMLSDLDDATITTALTVAAQARMDQASTVIPPAANTLN